MSTISMNCRRAASFAGTQCLSRLRRTHGVFSRLRRTHSVSRAYGGRTASLAPTADAQRLFAPTADAWRLFAPTAFPKKANREEFAFRSIWEGPTEASENFHTGKNYSPTTCEK